MTEYKDLILELSILEGGEFSDLRVSHYKMNNESYESSTSNEIKPIRLYVKVIGMDDDVAPTRNWGFSFRREMDRIEDSLKELLKKLL